MRLLDKYVLFRYIGKLLWAVLAAVVVFIALDSVEMLDKFIDAGVPAMTVVRYYYLYLPYILYLILPIATLLATLFTIGGLAMSNELTAMQLSGVSFFRPLGILLLTACVISVSGFFVGETLVPAANRERLDIYRYQVKKLPRDTQAKKGKLYMQLKSGEQLHMQRYISETKEAYQIQMVDIKEGILKRRVDAEKMVWLNNSWHFQGAIERVFGENDDVSWIANKKIVLPGENLRPDGFERVQTAPEEMDYTELKEFVSSLKETGGNTTKWEVDLYSKFSMPVAAIIIVLFGAPIASVKRRGGTALGFGLALFICFVYFGFIQVGKVIGYNGVIPPWLSAWMGNMFFGLLGLIVLTRTSQ